MVKCPATTKSFPWGKVLVGDFSWYHSTGAVPTALREREDDILPYSDGTKMYPFLTQKRYRAG